MRTCVSCILLLCAIHCLSQRISFEDPDLTFSFKKPNDWQVFDDGYVVKVSPTASDTSRLYFSITYFQDPREVTLFDTYEGDPAISDSKKTYRVRKDEIKPTIRTETQRTLHFYTFNKLSQRFQITTSQDSSDEKNYQKIFQKMIRSLRITPKQDS